MKNTALADRPVEFDVNAARAQFPALTRMVRGKPLAYLDNGASAQRPIAVLDAVDDYERRHHANIHRGVHTLSQEATALYETARDRLASFVNAGAVHAQSQQSCRGLLLSPTAEIDTRPQLEIHADEVKCAHGATTGRLDPDMLFYMLSRGLDRETAQSLLVYAFLADVLTGMSVDTARAAIENALIAQLPDSQTLRKFR